MISWFLKQNGPAIKALYEQYKKYKDDPIMGPQIESQLKALGIDPSSLDQLVPQIDQADAQLKQIDKALEDLDAQGSAMNFELGSKYADLTSAEGSGRIDGKSSCSQRSVSCKAPKRRLLPVRT
mgnify:CR=1 FL=1